MKSKTLILNILVMNAIGFVTGGILIWSIFQKVMKKDNQMIEKYRLYNQILNQWVVLKQEKREIGEFFKQKGYKTVGIYGMRELGERLLEDLENTGMDVKCIIDQNGIVVDKNILVLNPDDLIPEVDVIVVTASYYFNEIESKLKERVHGDIISIEDVIFGIY